MGAFEHFPYTNFHDLNLDWIIDKIREWEQSVKNFEKKFAGIETDWAEIEAEWATINQGWKNIQSDWVRLTNEVNTAIAQIDAKIDQGIGDYADAASLPIAAIRDLINNGDITENKTNIEHQTLSNAGIGITSGVFSSAASEVYYYAVTAGKSYKISGTNYTNPYTTTGVSAAFSKVAPQIGFKPADIILYGKTEAENVDIYYTPTEDGYIWLCESNISGNPLTLAESAFIVPPRFKLIKDSTEPSTNSIDLFRGVEITEEAYILLTNPATLTYECTVYSESGTFDYSFTFPERTIAGTIHLVRYTGTNQWLMEAAPKTGQTSTVFRSGSVIFTSEHLTNLKISTDLTESPMIPAGTRVITIGK